jgi:starch phosphorylase
MGKKLGKGEEKQDLWGSRRGLAPEALKRGLMDHLRYTQATIPELATLNDKYTALAYTVRDRLLHRWLRCDETYLKGCIRAVSYLSAASLLL